jgi:perosamine synthetase
MSVRNTIRFAHPALRGNENKYLLECLESGWISSLGEFIGRFGENLAQSCGTSFGVATNSGRSALHLALAALDTSPNDEIVVPTLTFATTANAVHYCGARPGIALRLDHWCKHPPE